LGFGEVVNSGYLVSGGMLQLRKQQLDRVFAAFGNVGYHDVAFKVVRVCTLRLERVIDGLLNLEFALV